MREFRAFSALVGRRAAMRYVALGAVATVVAACSEEEPGTDADPGAQQDGTSSGGVAKRTLEAFALGTWQVTAIYTGTESRPVAEGEVTIGKGSWTAAPGLLGDGEHRGTYAYTGGRLRLTGLEYFDADTQAWDPYSTEYSGEKLPAEVGGDQSVQVPWSNGDRSQTLTASWDEGDKKLTVSGGDFYEGRMDVTAVKQD